MVGLVAAIRRAKYHRSCCRDDPRGAGDDAAGGFHFRNNIVAFPQHSASLGSVLAMRLSATTHGAAARLWVIPMGYTVASLSAGLIVPRIERAYLAAYTQDLAVGSALAFFSAVGSGMMALTGMVFAIAFVVVQFSALAYSPRLVVMFASNPTLYHAMGIAFATFTYSLAAIVWTDRGAAGSVPLLSYLTVAVLLVISMIAFVRLIQIVHSLQIQNVLQIIGSHGRSVIRTMFPKIAENGDARIGPETITETESVTQTVSYSGGPLVITSFDIGTLVEMARNANAVISIECGVGETLLEETVLVRVYGAVQMLPEPALKRTINLVTSRTFQQDPKYSIRLLVDIAIRALSPAVNDPTTAVQALDQIEDLLRRLGSRQLDAGYASDAAGLIRVTFPVPTWEDYLALAFDEIRQFGAGSVQVLRRLRAALVGLADSIIVTQRRDAVLQYLDHLNRGVGLSDFDDQDREKALLEDRQGLGLTRKRKVQVTEVSRPAKLPVPIGGQ
jgi:uncharacterized membrane protein